MRTPVGREAVLRLHVDDADGVLTAADSTPSVSVKDSSGTTVSASSVASTATGVYTTTVSPRMVVDDLTVTWLATVGGVVRTYTDLLQITGARLLPFWRLKQDEELAELTGPALQTLSDTVEDWFRSALGYPVVEEFFSRTWPLKRTQTNNIRIPSVHFPKTLRSVTLAGDVIDIGDDGAQVVDGLVYRDAGFYAPFNNPVYGFRPGDQAVFAVSGTHDQGQMWSALPENLIRAGLILARYVSRGSNYPERARSIQTEQAIITFSTPSPDRPTGLPEVDNAVNRYKISTAI